MSRKYAGPGDESESEPGSDGRVLRNLLGITSPEAMDEAESVALLAALARWSHRIRATHRFTAVDIREMHRSWLGHIYAWAGDYRTVNVSRDGFPFASAVFIPRLMQELEAGELRRLTPAAFTEREEQARALAIVHAELVLIHPFREGNGRCARMLATLMGLQFGLLPLDFAPMDEDQRRYFDAIQAAQGHNYEPLTAVFSEVISETGGHRE